MSFDIPEPCEERWDAMAPRRAGRFCESCQHTVLDFSKMTRREAERRLRAAPDGALCGNAAFDAKGDPIFVPEPRRAPYWAGGLVLIAALSAGGCASAEDPIEATIARVEEPPCALDEPPMKPVTGLVASADAPTTGPVTTPEATLDAAAPTAEQERLTEQKREAATVAAHHHMRRGRIARRPRSGGL